MSLRCLLFSSDEATAAPIGQVLAELGVETEYCSNPVDAVERVTTQSFQLVITDWKDQPEAAFLLKTARDLKAAARPLTLAIVSEEARPHALQAGANSVLLKPLRPEQVRDTMSTACQLLRSKLQTSSPTAPPSAPQAGMTIATGSAAAAPARGFVVPDPEKLRGGEFLLSPNLTSSSQFETEGPKAAEATSEQVDSLNELEPMAAALQEVAQSQPERKEPLTGWAALQARLTKSAPAPPKEVPAQSEFSSYEDTAGIASAAARFEEPKDPRKAAENPPVASATASVSPDPEITEEENSNLAPARPARPAKRGRFFALALLCVSVALVAVPQTREQLRALSRRGARAALRWLNPPPAQVPQTVVQHDSFGQPDDEYRLPATGNIPDSTTDPSKIEVVPVIDPTAKQEKASSSNQAEAATGAQPAPGEQPVAASAQTAPANQNSAASTPQNQTVVSPVTNPGAATPGNTPVAAPVAAAPMTTVAPAQSSPAQSVPPQSATPQPSVPVAPPVQVQPASSPAAMHTNSPAQAPASQVAGIPSSLKSRVASTTPYMSGTKPDDSASSVIGPVNLPESALRGLLDQAPDPEYPAAAKASGQQGSVVLQVLIGPDGAVQDAKFMQGSFAFARAAIDGVKQWRFKPYLMNGRPVAVQSTITLNFKPPA
jgi:periplasmic protein TonB